LEKELPEISKYYQEEKEEIENLLIAYQKTVPNLISFKMILIFCFHVNIFHSK
jgi:hypothetical protein